jgi:hypothetical protein
MVTSNVPFASSKNDVPRANLSQWSGLLRGRPLVGGCPTRQGSVRLRELRRFAASDAEAAAERPRPHNDRRPVSHERPQAASPRTRSVSRSRSEAAILLRDASTPLEAQSSDRPGSHGAPAATRQVSRRRAEAQARPRTPACRGRRGRDGCRPSRPASSREQPRRR